MNNIFSLLGMLRSNPSQLAMSILQQAYQQRRINPMQFQMLSNSLQNGANPNQIIQQMLNSGMGTAGEISLAIVVDGTTVPSSTMIATPAAVEEYSNVAVAVSVPVWSGCCETLSIRNTSDQPILVQNANVILTRSNQSVMASC